MTDTPTAHAGAYVIARTRTDGTISSAAVLLLGTPAQAHHLAAQLETATGRTHYVHELGPRHDGTTGD